MSINELLASVGNKEMDRKDFLKFSIFVMASMVGIKNIVSLMAGVEINPDLTVKKKSVNPEQGNGFNTGRYNR